MKTGAAKVDCSSMLLEERIPVFYQLMWIYEHMSECKKNNTRIKNLA